jgi:thiamine-phosphate pyrophosphorylase
VIVDLDTVGEARSLAVTRSAVRGGADVIQLRSKSLGQKDALRVAGRIRKATRGRALFIVNDRADVALASGADGLHIGRGDISARLAARLLGAGGMLGLSVSDRKDIAAAKRCRPSYVGIGPVFRTPIKRSKRVIGRKLIEDVKRLAVPFFAIGGINRRNLNALTSRGVRSAAVIRAVCLAKDPFSEVRRLKEALAR